MLTKEEATARAAAIMLDFAERTGLRSNRARRRYLWTDAFAVCNLLCLARLTGEDRYLSLAVLLIDQVHQVLGRHRSDAARRGWLSGLGEGEGALHPTRGGLRIGKKLPERQPGEPYEERLEWDRDGQYFHYLTKWMQALDQAARVTREPPYHLWSRELAEVAHAAFCHGPPQGRRMVWKMSTDLRRPLVPAMGQHDPLDGLLTAIQIRSTAATLPGAQKADLASAIGDYASMIDVRSLGTDDPLGLGGLLLDVSRVVQLLREGAFESQELLPALIDAGSAGLRRYARYHDSAQPAARRLAFRELGLSIGISCADLVRGQIHGEGATGPAAARCAPLLSLELPWRLAATIREFWLQPEHQHGLTWIEHHDINEVMLATSLIPESMLMAPIAAR